MDTSNEKGMSLVELLVATGIAGIILVSVYKSTDVFMKAESIDKVKSNSYVELSKVSQQIKKKMSQATSSDVGCSVGSTCQSLTIQIPEGELRVETVCESFPSAWNEKLSKIDIESKSRCSNCGPGQLPRIKITNTGTGSSVLSPTQKTAKIHTLPFSAEVCVSPFNVGGNQRVAVEFQYFHLKYSSSPASQRTNSNLGIVSKKHVYTPGYNVGSVRVIQ